MRSNNGAMAHGVPCVNGNADRIRSANYETVLKLKIFFGSDRSSFHSPKFCAQIKWRITFCQTSRLFILLERAETEIRFSIANSMFKTKMDIDRQSPRLIPNNCKHLDPPYFSLPTTFNGQKYLILVHEVFFSMNPISLRDNKLFSMIVLF